MATSKSRSILLPAVLALAAAGCPECGATEPSGPSPEKHPVTTEEQAAPTENTAHRNATLKALVKAANYAYATRADGVLEIIADSGENPLVVLGTEGTAFTRKKNSEPVNIGVLIYKVLSLEAEVAANPPPELLRKINECNNHFIPGKYFVLGDRNPGVFYESAFWLSNATAATVRDELTNAYARRAHARRSLNEPDRQSASNTAQEPAKNMPTPVHESSPAKNAVAERHSDGLEALLKAGNYTYTKQPNGVLEIIADQGDDPLVLLGQDATAFTRKSGEHVKVGVISYKLASLSPELAKNPPVELLRKINVLNEEMDSGVCVLADHGLRVYYGSVFWLSNATAHTLPDEVANAYLRRSHLRKNIHEILDNLAPPPAAPPTDDALALRYVPPGASVVLAARPAELLAKPEIQPLAALCNQYLLPALSTAPRAEKMAEVQCIFNAPPPAKPVVVVRYTEPFDWKAFVTEAQGPPVAARVADQTYYHFDEREQPSRPAFFLPDDRTMVFGLDADVRRVIVADGKSKLDWAGEWNESATGAATAFIDLAAWGQVFDEELTRHPAPAVTSCAPIWHQGRRLVVSLRADDGLTLAARLHCETNENAEHVRETVRGAVTLLCNALEEADRQAANVAGGPAAAMKPLFSLGRDLLMRGKLTTDQREVHFALRLDLDDKTAGTLIAPAIAAAREAARTSQAMNNLKAIALGINIYYDIHGHFPPPVLLGPDGKTPHSWRVAILPCIEQVALYNQYHLDEPWDSENNKRVLAQMPATFRDPEADAGKLETSYFALVGSGTALGSTQGKGTKFAEITDGTSNTIAIVEAKRAVPWTKPEDIPCDPAKPLPNLGGWRSGGFFAALCDGSVIFFSESTDPDRLRAFISNAGGEPIEGP